MCRRTFHKVGGVVDDAATLKPSDVGNAMSQCRYDAMRAPSLFHLCPRWCTQ